RDAAVAADVLPVGAAFEQDAGQALTLESSTGDYADAAKRPGRRADDLQRQDVQAHHEERLRANFLERVGQAVRRIGGHRKSLLACHSEPARRWTAQPVKESAQFGKASPNIGRPLFDSDRVASP